MTIKDIIYLINNHLKDKLIIFGTFQQIIKNKINKNIKNFLISKYNCKFSVPELIYLLKNKDNLKNLHIFCPICGKKNIFRNLQSGYGYHCSKICVLKDKNVSKKRSINSYKTKEIRYGDGKYNNFKKAQETCKLKYNNISYMHTKEFREKSKNTNITLRGVQYALQDKDVRSKCYKTRTKDGKPYINYSKSKLTLEKHFGKNYRQIITNKIINTNIIKTGVKCIFQLKKYRDKLQLQSTKQKRYETMRRNKTHCNPSKPEDNCYNLLLTKFLKDDIERSYMNDKYPFKCDFYVKSLNLYIECHFSQFHQGKPFDKNNKQDLIKLLCLQLKSLKLRKNKNIKNQYDFMIYTWTDLDPRKLQTFKQNNLNYKIFYNLDEFLDWFETI